MGISKKQYKTFKQRIRNGYDIEYTYLLKEIEAFCKKYGCKPEDLSLNTHGTYLNYEESRSEIELKYCRLETNEEYRQRLDYEKFQKKIKEDREYEEFLKLKEKFEKKK